MIIVRYLIRETVKTQLAVLFVLFLVFFSQKFIRVLANATDGSIPGNEVLTLVGLYMPSMAMLMLPLSLYIGILITFGRLYAESEITVMNATGIGNKFLIRAALYLALITGAVAAFNALWLTPWANDKEIKVMESLEAESGLELLVKGQIQPSPDGEAVVYVGDITGSGKDLHKVFIAQPVPRGTMRPNVVVAEKGFVTELPDGRQVLDLNTGTRYEGVPTRLDYTVTEYENYQVLIGQREVRQKHRDWDAVPTQQLLNEPSERAQAELQWRISLVLCIPLMTMIVVPLSSVNPRQGRFAKLFPAVLLYLAYFLAISAAKSAIEEGNLAPEIGLWSVNIIALLVAFILISWDSLPMRKLKYRLRRAA
ncbi:LPS export ABC transporter permease LptF [Enterovibrio norvegicus]|uniref:LPS export ABC transporter permease LptF n=1 Tax=Enterovibrio norvegicus TaxID=188144 RepID=UPI000C8658E0|nr:LPS export ABC transporter permease LptF [Enterovibrio norvegicus]PML81451.1 LPS export ABC transporter permease LptF [Enterovibrio norvegicus]PMN69926.1 LPS export ABC transporter permease LptF [Enterovibrio norvegicus]